MKLPMNMPYKNKVLANAKKLRNNMTEEEKKLWYQYLSGYPIRFIRQKVVDSFVLDFYCAKCRLGVELDGSQHLTQQGQGHDEERTRLLNAYGITIIRFSNKQIRDEFGIVCRIIDSSVQDLLKT